jgi:hypothetical protein
MAHRFTIRWQASNDVSALHACQALLENRWLGPTAAADILHESCERLSEAWRDLGLPQEALWEHLLPLAGVTDSLTHLAPTWLAKVMGMAPALAHAACFRGLLTDVVQAFTAALPGANETAIAGLERLKSEWEVRGPALVNRATNWTEPGLMVEEALLAVVYPAAGGDGGAHLSYNMAWIEAVSVDPHPEMPELGRLFWLLGMLNLDLPRFSEKISRARLPMVAAWAMLPLAVTAAAECELIRQADERMFSLAATAWLGSEGRTDRLQHVIEWWEAYRMNRPLWATALAALDVVLG